MTVPHVRSFFYKEIVNINIKKSTHHIFSIYIYSYTHVIYAFTV